MVRLPGLPFQFAEGTKRSNDAASSNKAVPEATVPTALHVAPLFAEYCHTPCSLVLAFALIAIPASVLPSATSVKCPESKLATVAPSGSRVSSAIVASVVSLVSGGSATGLTVTVIV